MLNGCYYEPSEGPSFESLFVICRCPDNLSPVDIDLHGEDHCLASYLGFYCFYQKKLGRDFGQHFSMCQLCPARLSSAGLKCDHGSALGPHQLKYCILSQEPYFTSIGVPPPCPYSQRETYPSFTWTKCKQNLEKMSKSNNWDKIIWSAQKRYWTLNAIASLFIVCIV